MTLTRYRILDGWWRDCRLAHSEGVSQLKKLNASTPGNVSLLTSLAKQMFADNKPQEGVRLSGADGAISASGRGIAADMWFGEIKSMPVSKASVQALQRFLLQFPQRLGRRRTPGRCWRNSKRSCRTRLSAPKRRAGGGEIRECGAGGGRSAAGGTRRMPAIAMPLGALGAAYSQRGDRARAVAQLNKDNSNQCKSSDRDKWDSLLKTNRYWLLIKQGDNALKAGQLAQAQNAYAQAQRVDNTDSYAVLGLGDVADGAQR